jgi:O-antigen ligase
MSHPRSRPVWAISLWAALVCAILVAWSPRYWAVSAAISSISILAVVWAAISWFNRANALELPPQTILIGLIGAWGYLQVLFGTTFVPRMTIDASLIWVIGAVAFILGSQFLRDRAARNLFLELLLWSSTVLGTIAMMQLYNKPVEVFGIFPAPDTVVGTFISPNQFAALMEIAAPIALWYMIERNLGGGALCFAMILAATITAGSRAGVILLSAELMVFLCMVLFARRRKAKAIMAIFAGMVVLVAIGAAIAGMDKIRERFEEKNPYAVRRELFDSTLKMIAERPWTGYGMGTWRAVYPRRATFDMAVLANEAHNDWAQWTSDGGVPFFLLMAGLVLSIAVPSIRSIWGLGVLSVMAHSYVDYPTREPALAFLWFALAGAVTQSRGGSRALGRPSGAEIDRLPAFAKGSPGNVQIIGKDGIPEVKVFQKNSAPRV